MISTLHRTFLLSALATAVLEGEITVEDLRAVRVGTPDEALRLAPTGVIPVLVAPELTADRRPPILHS